MELDPNKPNSRTWKRKLKRLTGEAQKLLKLNNLRRIVTASYPANDCDSTDEPEVESEQEDEETSQEQMSVGDDDDLLNDNENEDIDDLVINNENEDVDDLASNNEGEAGEDLVNSENDDAEASDIDSNRSQEGDSDNASQDSADSDSDEEHLFENEEERALYLLGCLRDWARSPGVISLKKIDDLLKRVHVAFPIVPLSYKTLLQAGDVPLNIDELNDGSFIWYKGIVTNLDALVLEEYLDRYLQIVIDVNMDGLPLHNSTKKKFWPILGHLVHTDTVFIIAIYSGKRDPLDVHSYLTQFVEELRILFGNGYTRNGIEYVFKVRNYILDAPARSLVKCCIGHGGYGACEKCCVVGERVAERTVYLDMDAPLRTDESFAAQEDELHHTGQSPLLGLGTGMVSQFRLDSFHLVWHGVFRRFLEAVMTWNIPGKLTAQNIDDISNELIFLIDFCPSDFNRPPRSLVDWKYLKGHEERRLCLYDGILVLQRGLHENLYKLYLLLHAGLYILASPHFVKLHCEYAGQLLRTFVEFSRQVFGRKFIVYNVHSLLHLSDECTLHGALDEFSAFPFENRLKSIKDSLKSGFRPLQQAAKRDLERNKRVEVQIDSPDEVEVVLQGQYNNPAVEGRHYKSIKIRRTILKIGEGKDSCFSTTDEVLMLRDIVERNGQVFLLGKKFRSSEDFYLYPLPSSQLGILKVKNLEHHYYEVPLGSVKSKII